MLINLDEIVEVTKYSSRSMMGPTFVKREISINPDHIVCLKEDEVIRTKINGPNRPDFLSGEEKFTKIYLNRGHSGIDVVVMGDVNMVREKIKSMQQKKVLLG